MRRARTGYSLDRAALHRPWSNRGKVPLPFPPHVAKDVREARMLRELVRSQGRMGAAGHVQGERALSRIEHVLEEDPEHAAANRIDPAKARG